ncbi:MAG: ABC transporter permease [Dehalococcoidia bacterium]|nr:ABC transporter permease [Dehalococcoidia bacterium]
MAGYALRRILSFIPLIWAIATITFFLMHTVPGGPFDTEKPLPPAAKANLEAKYDLDGSLLDQYVAFLRTLSKGDLGISFNQDRPVKDIISERLPKTLQLGVCAFAFALAGGLTLGIVAATNHNRWPDYASVFIATVGAAVPNFVVGVFLIIFFALKLGWFDVIGWEFGNPRTMVLPTVALGLLPLAFIARITRASMLEVMRQDYIRTARSKGVTERVVIMQHAIRNALIPVLTVAGPIFAGLITGSFVVERFFAVGGVGTAFVDAVSLRDYGMIMGTTLLYAMAIAVVNLVVDLAYGFADPRIRY